MAKAVSDLVRGRAGGSERLYLVVHSMGGAVGQADDPVLRQRAGWADACPVEAFHVSAGSLVAWPGSGELLDMFHDLAVPKAYVSGQHSANPDVLARLDRTIAKYQIADCGHFPMLEKPEELSRILREGR